MKGTVKENAYHIAYSEHEAYYEKYSRIYHSQIIKQTEYPVKGEPRRHNGKSAPPRNVYRLGSPRRLVISLELLLTAHAFIP